jgi:hypothetical protein
MVQGTGSDGGKDDVGTAALFKSCDQATTEQCFALLELLFLGCGVVDQQPFRHAKMSRQG